jgi:hypothetical protein
MKKGDSISESSSLAKKRALPNENVLGDRIDLRVLKKVDLFMTFPIANLRTKTLALESSPRTI